MTAKSAISISIWCDWELEVLNHRHRFVHFNSNMVRLGVINYELIPFLIHISIPLWYDWECSNDERNFMQIDPFQFHFGTIGSVAVDMFKAAGL